MVFGKELVGSSFQVLIFVVEHVTVFFRTIINLNLLIFCICAWSCLPYIYVHVQLTLKHWLFFLHCSFVLCNLFDL